MDLDDGLRSVTDGLIVDTVTTLEQVHAGFRGDARLTRAAEVVLSQLVLQLRYPQAVIDPRARADLLLLQDNLPNP